MSNPSITKELNPEAIVSGFFVGRLFRKGSQRRHEDSQSKKSSRNLFLYRNRLCVIAKNYLFSLTGNRNEAATAVTSIPPTTAKDTGDDICTNGPISIFMPINASISASP